MNPYILELIQLTLPSGLVAYELQSFIWGVVVFTTLLVLKPERGK